MSGGILSMMWYICAAKLLVHYKKNKKQIEIGLGTKKLLNKIPADICKHVSLSNLRLKGKAIVYISYIALVLEC